jgi:hypothetical protein
MPREMSADFLAAITSQAIRPAIFVELDFTSGADYFWSGRGTISWNGHDWMGWRMVISSASACRITASRACGRRSRY